jgi:phosphoglycolate phosphatase
MRKPLAEYRHAVWDWNGTLLDDTWLCCASLNLLLAEDGHPSVDPERYRQIFEFPVIKVYQAIGFTPDEASFRAMSVRFMTAYEARKLECRLHPGALDLLDGLSAQGCSHSVLSAYERTLLEATLGQYGLRSRFRKACGGDDIHAGSKEERARRHLDDLGLPAGDVLYVGDTAHDAESARAMGVDCVLVAHGHQHRTRLEGLGVRVVAGFSELLAELPARP